MRTLLLAGVAVVGLMSVQPARAQGTVWCANCSTWMEDNAKWAWDAVQWAHNLEQQIIQVEQAIQSNIYLLKSTIDFPDRLFNDVTGGIRQIESLADQVGQFGDQTKFMISNLGHAGRYGGSLEDIPLALAQEDQALAAIMGRLGVVSNQTKGSAQTYSAQLAALQGQDVSGQTQATQIGNQIAATTGQWNAAQATVTNTALQALATAEVRRADRESLIAAKAQQDRSNAIAASCSQLTTMHPPVCQQQPGSGGGGGAVSPAGSYVAVASPSSDAAAYAINAAPNTQ